MLRNPAYSRLHATRCVESWYQAEQDGRERNTLDGRRLAESSMHRSHGLATILTMATV